MQLPISWSIAPHPVQKIGPRSRGNNNLLNLVKMNHPSAAVFGFFKRVQRANIIKRGYEENSFTNKQQLQNINKYTKVFFVCVFLLTAVFGSALAQPTQPAVPVPPTPPQGLTISIGGAGPLGTPDQVSTGLKILGLLTVLSLAPAILTMMTCFVRIVVVLGFVRRAMGTQEVPPNQVVIGLALFLTFFVMAPVFQKMNDQALQPYLAGKISIQQAYQTGISPLRDFLFDHTRDTDLALFVKLSKIDQPKMRGDIPTHVLIPAYLISELKTSFIIGFIIYIPFLIIDMVVASILLSMGMMMLPPVIISLPFKVLLFVLVDGWNLVIGSLMKSF